MTHNTRILNCVCIRRWGKKRSSENLPRAPELYLQNRSEPSGKNNTDISECSTVTDDYVTCTENSRRTPGIRSLQGASSSSTQVPGWMPNKRIIPYLFI